MPEWLAVIILGIVEGITEFLPISSTGHLLLTEHFIGQKQPDVFIAVIQSGAVLAVLLAFLDRLKNLALTWRSPETRSFVLKLAAAFMITGVGGVLLKKAGFKLPVTPGPIAWATLIGGILILLIEWALRKRALTDQISWTVAIAIGAGQLLAVIFPGLSRSGATILMALAMGLSRPKATEFSFLLGIPTLLAAGALEIYGALKPTAAAVPVNWSMLALGTLVSAATAFATVKWLLRYVQSHTFVPFGWYRVAIGILILAVI